MKKTITRLALKRETVRTLVEAELAHVAGGLNANCTNMTGKDSGCTEVAANPPIK